MTVYKCKMCGGDLNINEGMTVCECEYCGTKQTVPTANDEKKMTLFNRANRLRFNCEFDKAAGVYESIVADFPEEAEAYWGLVLCKYGIEYVDDPATAKKIPTCHRSSFESVMDDENFEQVMENSDITARLVYRGEAKQIEELRKSIIEVSAKEEPYDIFICYKETDENGDRTIDSAIAQDVYDALTEKGYKVFFSRISLEDKLGQEYEPYIFAALNSAKIMLAFGTDYEYYNAVWVKNEWSRFLQLISKGEKKTLIPCYKNIDAYDMPKEFAKLQAQDMGKVGAIQDLLRGIDKLTGRDGRQEQPAAVNTAEKNPGIKEIAIEDGGLYTGEAVANKPHGKGSCIYPDGRSYSGGWAFGKYNGQGTLTYADCSKYEGRFKDGKCSGTGTLIYPDGEKLSGEWKDGIIWIGSGKYVYDNGDFFAGEIRDGKKSGQGIYIFANNNRYEGEWKDDKRNGTGTLTYANGDRFEGEWKDDRRHGQGVLIYSDGTSLSGEWKDGRIWMGSGKYVYDSGDFFVGKFRDGKKNGQGIYTFANNDIFEGEWKDDKRNGTGTLTYANGNKYDGEWKDDRIWMGFGKVIYSNGFYVGEFKEGERKGQGTFYFANDDLYEGEWRYDKRNGFGILTCANGDKYEGEWKDDLFNDYGTYTYADGKSWSGDWDNGKPYNGKGYWNGEKVKYRKGRIVNSIF